MDINGSFGGIRNWRWIRDLQSIERDSERGSTKRLGIGMGIQPQGERRLKLTTPTDVVASLRTFTITVQTPQGALHRAQSTKRGKEREKKERENREDYRSGFIQQPL